MSNSSMIVCIFYPKRLSTMLYRYIELDVFFLTYYYTYRTFNEHERVICRIFNEPNSNAHFIVSHKRWDIIHIYYKQLNINSHFIIMCKTDMFGVFRTLQNTKILQSCPMLSWSTVFLNYDYTSLFFFNVHQINFN